MRKTFERNKVLIQIEIFDKSEQTFPVLEELRLRRIHEQRDTVMSREYADYYFTNIPMAELGI
jgi:hypothetical protein